MAQVTYAPDLAPEARQAVYEGLRAFNQPIIGTRRVEPLQIIARRSDGTIAGGLVGETRWTWLYVDLLWVAEDVRGEGVGTQLMQLAETEAIQRGCRGIWLDTLDYQARGFYERLGFAIFGTQPDYPPGHERYFLLKRFD